MKARPMLKGFFGLFAAAAILSAGLIPAADLSPAPAMRLKLTGAVYIHSYPPTTPCGSPCGPITETPRSRE